MRSIRDRFDKIAKDKRQAQSKQITRRRIYFFFRSFSKSEISFPFFRFFDFLLIEKLKDRQAVCPTPGIAGHAVSTTLLLPIGWSMG
jgi:hypothetical protein